MKRCYEVENYKAITGSDNDGYNHCGHSRRLENGLYYCPNDGNLMKICGYMGMCADIKIWDKETQTYIKPQDSDFEQITFDTMKGGRK